MQKVVWKAKLVLLEKVWFRTGLVVRWWWWLVPGSRDGKTGGKIGFIKSWRGWWKEHRPRSAERRSFYEGCNP